MKCTKDRVATEETEERLDHAKSLATQGQLHHLVDEDSASLWSEVVQKLPPECMKFVLNAAQDTLPHNANLSVWRRKAGLFCQCKLCNERQTLLHILNNCKVELKLCRYNQRHDSVLRVIIDSLQSQCAPDFYIMADLPNCTYDFPASAASTDLRPDLVVWSDSQWVMVLVELTICFETNFVDAHQRKSAKYYDLLETCTANGYNTSLVTIEVGSRGFVNLHGFEQLLRLSRGERRNLLRAVAREAILQLRRIWT